MGRHSKDREPNRSDSDLVIYRLAKMVDAYRCEQMVGWVRSEEEAERDVLEIIEDAWNEVSEE